MLALGIKGFELFLTDLIKVFHNGKIGRLLLTVVGSVRDTESGVELHQQNFDGVELLIREILVGAEEILN